MAERGDEFSEARELCQILSRAQSLVRCSVFCVSLFSVNTKTLY